MAITKTITWTVNIDDGNGEIVLRQREEPDTFQIVQGNDTIYLDAESARETYRALGEMIDHANNPAESVS